MIAKSFYQGLDLSTDNLHHAYCFLGERVSIRAGVFEIVEKKLKIKTEGNPDFFVIEREVLVIDDARTLREAGGRRAFTDGLKIFVIAFDSATIEAQNALLKFTEEPTVRTVLFLIAPSVEVFLPTLRSRLNFVKPPAAANGENKQALEFLLMDIGKRISISKSFADDFAKEKISKREIVSFLDGLEKVVYTQIGLPAAGDCLDWIIKTKKYLSGRSVSVKLLMESVALLLLNKK